MTTDLPSADRLLEEAAWPKPRPLRRGILPLLALLTAAGAVAFLLLLNGANPVRAWQIFLVNFLFWSGVAVAGVVLAAIFQVTNARWARPLKRLAEACAAYLPVSFLLFLCIWFGRRSLFSWIDQPPAAIAAWLNSSFFFLREAVGLLALYGMSLLFFYRSVRQDSRALAHRQAGDSPRTGLDAGFLHKLGVGLLILYAFVYSLVALDFVMSLDPAWSSTLFGAYYFMGNLYLGLAAVTVFTLYARWRYQLEKTIDSRILHNLGKLLFAFSLLWTYLFWSQYLVIWYGNLPHETGFLILRIAHEPWSSLAVVVLTMNFLVPFLVLLPRSRKENPGTLLGIALVILTGMWLERYLLVAPSLAAAPEIVLGGAEALITLGFLASFLLAYLTVLSKVPILPVGDPLFWR
ncbi:MAG: hypothetical protein O7E51_00965 [Acidobacteria bacterium]|nr:hypothetical protein [Acidobacteriota bacterium]